MTKQTMERQVFESVWDAIEDTPEEAENMKLRSALMMAVEQKIKDMALTQAQAAKLLGVTQPRVSDLMRGKIDLFGLDALINMVVAMGLRIQVQVSDRLPLPGFVDHAKARANDTRAAGANAY